MTLVSFKWVRRHSASDEGGARGEVIYLVDVVPNGIPSRPGKQEIELAAQVRGGMCASAQAICFKNGLSNSSSALGLRS